MTKSNGTSFKKGRKKTGGRAAGTPNKATRSLREEMLAGAEAAGNEVGGDGRVSYWKWVALDHPNLFVPKLAAFIPQVEPEKPPEAKDIRTIEDLKEDLREFGIQPEAFAYALIGPPELVKPEISTGRGARVKDASDASTRGGEV